MPHPTDNQPAEGSLLDVANSMAIGLERVFNGDLQGDARPVRFVLLAFPVEDRSSCVLSTNGVPREEIVHLFEELLERFHT